MAPSLGRKTVVRRRLLERLERSREWPLVVVNAGPGYGKTTVLTQWVSAGGPRRFAWVSLDDTHNDPIVLLTYVAAALDRVSPIDPRVFDALASPGASIFARVLPRLGAALAAVDEPLVLVLDDVHVIENEECVDAIVTLVGHLAEGSTMVLATRDRSALPMAKLRARSLEVGADDLRMGVPEASALLRAADVECADGDVTDLVDHTEGWPAGLYLAARSVGAPDGGPREARAVTGNDPFVVDFLRAEFLAGRDPDEVAFLTRASVLEHLSGPLCDATLQRDDSAVMLEALERSNAFVVALDRDRTWYRCHHLVRELLGSELRRTEPAVVSALHVRAGDWCLQNGHVVWAMGHAQADGDADRVAALIERAGQPVFQSGRGATLEQWLTWLRTHAEPSRYPAAAIAGSMFFAAIGQPTEANRWAVISEHGGYTGPLPDGTESIETWRAMLRALRSRDGLEAMHADAAFAVETIAPGSIWRPISTTMLGLSEMLAGDADAADDRFVDVIEMAPHVGAHDLVPAVMAVRALIAIDRDEWDRALELTERAVWTTRGSRRQDSPSDALTFAVATRAALHFGRSSEALALLAESQRRLPQWGYAIPVPATQTRLELARVYVALGDARGAETMLREANAILRRCQGLGNLGEQTAELHVRLGSRPHDGTQMSALSTAELRVVPLLSTHLTFAEIGTRLHISRNTVKSHAMAIYRKLGVSSRSEAVDRARELGLLSHDSRL